MTAFVLTLVGAALAVALELLEALAIVMAVGSARRWRDAVIGALGAVVLLAVVVVAVGPLLLARLPLEPLQVVIGVALLLFGLEWLRKGVLRLAGPPLALVLVPGVPRGARGARGPGAASPGPPDWPARVVAGKGVLLEGVEVVLIVAALGAGPDGLAPAVAGAAARRGARARASAFVLHRPLMRLPESHLKYAVGIVLSSFGVFFLGEGVGVEWPRRRRRAALRRRDAAGGLPGRRSRRSRARR